MRRVAFLLIFFIRLVLVLPLSAQGFFRPVATSSPLPEIISHNVSVDIQNQLATVRVELGLRNPTKEASAATFYFPLPAEAIVSNFKLQLEKTGVQGRLAELPQARQIYDKILAKELPPEVLSAYNKKLFSADLDFPAKSKFTLKFEYTELVSEHGSMLRYVYPLQKRPPARSFFAESNGIKPAKRQGESIRVQIQSHHPLKNIFVPGHETFIDFKKNAAEILYKGKMWQHERDFEVFYGEAGGEVGMDLLTYRKDGSEDGYFALLLSADAYVSKNKILPKNLIFVVDACGGMDGPRMRQVKAALQYCINNLNKNDKFNIITFSSDIKLFDKKLVPAGAQRKQALEFINNISPAGGANVNQALLTALDMQGTESGFNAIIFITDGLPTVGLLDVEAIRQNVQRLNQKGYRIFSFGLDYQVNTYLLDGMARDNFAFAEYIEPNENLEIRIAAFFDKISQPVLGMPQIDLGGIGAYDVYPQALPDLFAGSQIMVVGRYKHAGKRLVRVTGESAESGVELSRSYFFPAAAGENDFVARLWAARKTGHLMENLSLKQGTRECRRQILELSREFALFDACPAAVREQLTNGDTDFVENEKDGRVNFAESGRQAVTYSKTCRSLKQSHNAGSYNSPEVKFRAGQTFILSNGVWQDTDYEPENPLLHIKAGSEAYLNLLQLAPTTAEFMSLGPEVVFALNSKFIRVSNNGTARLSKQEIKEHFR